MTDGERIAVLEAKVEAMRDAFKSHSDATEARHKEMAQKLDDLLALRNKGIGAFWLASALTGTGIIGMFLAISDWIRGWIH